MAIWEGGTPERPATFFDTAEDFRAWLEEHHETASELWMGLHKRHVVDRGLTWEEAVPEALCFGWIDSLAQRIDDDSRRQRWTPRRAGSVWSTVNIALVEQLTADGRMRPAGLAAYERRKAERSGVYAYERGQTELAPEQLARLQDVPAAWAFWQEATATYRRICATWVTSAKREQTRESRLAQLVECSAAGELIPSQRYGDRPRWVERATAAARRA